jgi:hypothetical protein
MIEVFPSNDITPQQALLSVDEAEMQYVAIVYVRKGEYTPILTISDMDVKDLYFLGGAIQEFALNEIRE